MITKTDEARPVDRAGSGVNDRTLESIGSQKEKEFRVCPLCGGRLVYGSHDPCEGYYYWCAVCGEGPYLRSSMLHQQAPIIQAGPVSSACDVCGIMTCDKRTEAILRCHEFRSMDLQARTLRDMPENEPRLRGMASGQELAKLQFHSRRGCE
jgi:hypothetical protein